MRFFSAFHLAGHIRVCVFAGMHFSSRFLRVRLANKFLVFVPVSSSKLRCLTQICLFFSRESLMFPEVELRVS